MTERPILFSAPMVRALLAGTKTQTRRVVKEPSWALPGSLHLFNGQPWADDPYRGDRDVACPYGPPGSKLWVREAFAIVPRTAYRCSEGVQQTPRPDDDHDAAIYREGWTRSNGGFRWRPSIHMPRWASRITLEVTGVRVERLQDISQADAIAEGIERSGECNWRDYVDHPHNDFTGPRRSYRSLWESINGPSSWGTNPWVWAVSFKRLEVA